MKLKILAPMLFFATLFFSCSDNSNDLDPNCSLENAMMLKVGNYWIYNTVQIDENGNAIAGTEGIDSSFVSRIQTVAGKQAFEMITHRRFIQDKSLKLDTTYYAVEGNQAYMLLAKSVENVMGYCHCMTHDWVVFADCSRKQWPMMRKTIQSDRPFEVLDANNNIVKVDVQYKIDITGTILPKQDISLETKSINTSVFQNSGTMAMEILGDTDAKWQGGGHVLKMELRNKIYLGEGIGIVRQETTRIDPRDKSEQRILKTLLRYSVK